MKYWIPILITLTVLITVYVFSAPFTKCPKRGSAFDSWETTNNRFKIRITAYEEVGRSFSPSRPYYVFESDAISPGDWREIMTIRDESRPEIPREQIRFLSERVAYVFMGSKYAVTTDYGRTWCVWDAARTLPKRLLHNSDGIQQVDVDINGVGTMRLVPIPQWQEELPLLHTKDYGYHWDEK